MALTWIVACGDDSQRTPLGNSGQPPNTMMDASVAAHLDAAMGGNSGHDSEGDAARDASQSDATRIDVTTPTALSLKMATYNVAGLPEGFSSSSPDVNSALISPLLNMYQLALLQEDFRYHTQIISAANQPYKSMPDLTAQSLGDGLNFLSDAPFTDLTRVQWTDCNGLLDSGSDCLTPKGFAVARFTLAPGIEIDVYDLHADAGSAMADHTARAKNLRQIAAYINAHSTGRAVIVAGDTNARYSDAADNVPDLVDMADLHDVWIDFVRGGVRPTPGVTVTCSDTDLDDPQCERLDKVFYRNAPNGSFTLRPTAYSVDGAKFVDAMGNQLSDHRPVSVTFAADMP